MNFKKIPPHWGCKLLYIRVYMHFPLKKHSYITKKVEMLHRLNFHSNIILLRIENLESPVLRMKLQLFMMILCNELVNLLKEHQKFEFVDFQRSLNIKNIQIQILQLGKGLKSREIDLPNQHFVKY
jgi:hypothetical protein